jgi:hypothetical protein
MIRRRELGPHKRPGFIEALRMGPPNLASSRTAPPMAIAAACPRTRSSAATAMMTNMRKKVSIISRPKDWPSLTVGP